MQYGKRKHELRLEPGFEAGVPAIILSFYEDNKLIRSGAVARYSDIFERNADSDHMKASDRKSDAFM